MSISARPYQIEAIDSIHDGWKDPEVKHQIVCMSTGLGKTIVASILTQREVQRGGRVLIIAHTDELIDQMIDKFQRTTGMKAGREKASSYASRYDKVVVGSIQTMQGDLRLSSWPKNHFTVVIVDECHHVLAAGYLKVLNHFISGGAKVIGLTATTDRGDKRALGEFFHAVAYDYGLLKGVLDGWLVRLIVKTMPVKIDLNNVPMERTPEGNDISRRGVSERLAPFMDKIAEAIRDEIGKEKVLIFLPSVETAQIMSQALTTAGVSSNWVCGDKKICPDRRVRVARHQRGEFQALSNMAVLTEGYDDDSIKNIVCLRATKIRSLFCQILGRGSRPLNAIVPALNAAANAFERVEIIRQSDKPHVRILDFLWLYEKHDLCTPASLVTKDERLAELMAGKDGDLIEAEAQAERDLLKKLEEEVRKNARRKSTVVDPLALATELGDVELATYEPETAHEALPVTEPQKVILSGNGINVEKVKSRGHASRLIAIILKRHARGLATIRQLNFFKKIGVDASHWTKEQASQRQQEKIREWQRRRAEQKQHSQELDAEVAEVARQLNFDVDTMVESSRRVRSSYVNAANPPLPDPNAVIEDFSDIFGEPTPWRGANSNG